VTKASAPIEYSTLSGSFKLKAPRGGAVTDVTVQGDAGPCTASCPPALAPNVEITCQYTCPGGTKWVNPSCKVDSYLLVAPNTTVSWSMSDGLTKCVVLSSAFFKDRLGAAWTDRTICQDSPAAAFQFTVQTPPPLVAAGQCPTFNSTYPVRGREGPGEMRRSEGLGEGGQGGAGPGQGRGPPQGTLQPIGYGHLHTCPFSFH
jgi:hypothetical protein